MLTQASCTRSFYRKEADKDVGEILAQKDKFPAWAIQDWHVYPDPRARFADKCIDPDHPPMPPDDPAAYDLSPNPQKPGKAGIERVEGSGYLELIAKWDQENRTRRDKEQEEERSPVEPPVQGPTPSDLKTPTKPESRQEGTGPKEHDPANEIARVKYQAPPSPEGAGRAQTQYPVSQTPGTRDALVEASARSLLDISGRPSYLLTLDQAEELALFNSREFQDQRENLYLAALPVSAERFSLMAQFFAASEAIRNEAGSEAPGGKQNNWALNNGIGMSKILPTGGLVLLGFSNQTVFNFLNPKSTTSVSMLNFDVIQPFLRGGGKAVTLEPLTLTERNLVYQIRNYARFRKNLYVFIASNNGGAISGGSFQASGVLSNGFSTGVSAFGSSGLVPGAIPGVSTTINGPLTSPGTSGVINITPALTPPSSGYLNTMLQKITVYIDQENIDTLSAILLRYRAYLEGDVVGPLQVQSVEQQLLQGRSTLVADQQNYLQSLNQFKVAIGVPENLNIEMDDSELRPLTRQFRRARAIIDDEHAAAAELAALLSPDNIAGLRTNALRLFERSALVRGTPFAKTIRERWAAWQKLSPQQAATRLEGLRNEERQLLDRQADLLKSGQVLSDADHARRQHVEAEIDLGSFEGILRRYESDYLENGKPKQLDPTAERRRITHFQAVVGAWQRVAVEARTDRWTAVRASWPELPRVCVDGVDLLKADLDLAEHTVANHALANRLDLMNVRAQVVDAWRQLAVFANALLGTFNVEYRLTASSPAGAAQPLNIGGSATSHQLVLDATLPLVRIQERNNYRAALIGYQRQRRALEEAEDLAVQAVQIELTNLRQFAEQYKIQQRQLELAYVTIDSALESLSAPTAPPSAFPGLARTPSDGPAALTQQLLSAQRTLPTAQSSLLGIWINYLNSRLQLYRDLELMPLDERNRWIDQVRDCDCLITGANTPPGDAKPGASPSNTPKPESIPAPKREAAPTEAGKHTPQMLPPAVEGVISPAR